MTENFVISIFFRIFANGLLSINHNTVIKLPF